MIKNRTQKGFTIIELMLVIAILSIIAVVALPSFLDQVRKARRSDAKQTLMDVAARLEQYYQDNKGYPAGGDMTDIGYPSATFESPEGYYTVSFAGAPTATTYTIQAVPKDDQTKDKTCKTFSYNHLGVKAVSVGDAKECW